MSRTVPTPLQSTSPRYEDIDAMRAVLMFLSLLLHAATVYAVNRPHITHNDDRSIFMSWVVSGLHLTITPSFFVISAFFVSLMLSRASWQAVLVERIRRLALPTLCVALTFNMLELYLRQRTQTGQADSFLSYFGSPEFAHVLYIGKWQLHLWFMVQLMIFVSLILLTVAVLPRVAAFFGKVAESLGAYLAIMASGSAGFLALLLGLSIGSFALLGLAAQLPHAYEVIVPGLATPYALSYFLPFFIFGLLLHRSPALRTAALKYRRWMPLLMLAGVVLQPYPSAKENFWFQAELVNNVALQNVMQFAQFIVCWSFVLGGLQIFHHYCRAPSALRRTWVGRAHSMYLFHHCLVYIGGMCLTLVHLPPIVEFLILSIVVTLLVVILHDGLVMRIPLLGLMFNGHGKFRFEERLLAARRAPAVTVDATVGVVPPAGAKDAIVAVR